MTNDDTPDPADPTGGRTEPDQLPDAARADSDPVRERYRLRAQCAKLRHWCRDLLRDAELWLSTHGVIMPWQRSCPVPPPEKRS